MKRLCWLLWFVSSIALAVPSTGSPGLPPLPASMTVPAAAASSAPAAVAMAALPRMTGARIDLRFVPVAQVVDLIYADLLQAPYVIDPDVLADTRPVSFRYDKAQGDVRAFLSSFLDSLGYSVTERDGVSYVSKSKISREEKDRQTLVYTPRYRHADYLSRIVQPMVQGHLAENRNVAAPEGAKAASDVPAASAAGQIDQSSDVLVYVGSGREVEMLRKLLPQLDTPVGEVIVRGWAYEVDDTDDTNTGFTVASKLFGVGVQIGAGSTSSDTNALQFASGRLELAISALNANSRFHQMSAPNVRCVSGQQVKLNVGQEVPTVSSVSYQGTSGTPVQSVQYQDAGVIFNVMPTVLQDVIELHIDEEISSFVNTTTGVDGSPTKNTRSLQTVASMKDGEVIVLGGLMQDQNTISTSGQRFLPHFLDGHTTSKARTEVVLVLQVQKI
jgi:general secretion pathway protein D